MAPSSESRFCEAHVYFHTYVWFSCQEAKSPRGSNHCEDLTCQSTDQKPLSGLQKNTLCCHFLSVSCICTPALVCARLPAKIKLAHETTSPHPKKKGICMHLCAGCMCFGQNGGPFLISPLHNRKSKGSCGQRTPNNNSQIKGFCGRKR